MHFEKGVLPSPIWSKRGVVREVLDSLQRKHEREPLSIKPTLFKREHCGGELHVALLQHVDTILNGTRLNRTEKAHPLVRIPQLFVVLVRCLFCGMFCSSFGKQLLSQSHIFQMQNTGRRINLKRKKNVCKPVEIMYETCLRWS